MASYLYTGSEDFSYTPNRVPPNVGPHPYPGYCHYCYGRPPYERCSYSAPVAYQATPPSQPYLSSVYPLYYYHEPYRNPNHFEARPASYTWETADANYYHRPARTPAPPSHPFFPPTGQEYHISPWLNYTYNTSHHRNGFEAPRTADYREQWSATKGHDKQSKSSTSPRPPKSPKSPKSPKPAQNPQPSRRPLYAEAWGQREAHSTNRSQYIPPGTQLPMKTDPSDTRIFNHVAPIEDPPLWASSIDRGNIDGNRNWSTRSTAGSHSSSSRDAIQFTPSPDLLECKDYFFPSHKSKDQQVQYYSEGYDDEEDEEEDEDENPPFTVGPDNQFTLIGDQWSVPSSFEEASEEAGDPFGRCDIITVQETVNDYGMPVETEVTENNCRIPLIMSGGISDEKTRAERCIGGDTS
ncbi:hypothetical protein F5Y11DRAFT_233889 [Daldinia sp. FL1419]|nr:hypothetical protein F5Y11DRAFT_233889 [Daldinia sp. FL1419]